MSEIKSFYFIAKHYSKKCTLTGLNYKTRQLFIHLWQCPLMESANSLILSMPRSENQCLCIQSFKTNTDIQIPTLIGASRDR